MREDTVYTQDVHSLFGAHTVCLQYRKTNRLSSCLDSCKSYVYVCYTRKTNIKVRDCVQAIDLLSLRGTTGFRHSLSHEFILNSPTFDVLQSIPKA